MRSKSSTKPDKKLLFFPVDLGDRECSAGQQYSYVAIMEGRERGGMCFLCSPVQCPVLVTMLHFTSSQIISLFSPARDQPGGPHSVAAFTKHG